MSEQSMLKSLSDKLAKSIIDDNSTITLEFPIIPFLLKYKAVLRPSDFFPRQQAQERIEQLGQIRSQLLEVVSTIDDLEVQAKTNKTQVEALQLEIERLRQDKSAAEALLSVPEESAVRIISRANSIGKWRGRLEGLLIGIVSSLLVWLFTLLFR